MRKKVVEKKIEVRIKIMWSRLKREVTSTLLEKINSRGYDKQSDYTNQM